MPAEVTLVSEIVQSNGKTIRENNMAREHEIPVGTLVEVEISRDEGLARSRTRALMFVVGLHRDCDGTPLYSLSLTHPDFMEDVRVTHQHGTFRLPFNAEQSRGIYYRIEHGYSAESLRVVDNPVYDPSFLRQWLPNRMYQDWGEFGVRVLYKQVGVVEDEEAFDPGDYPEHTCYVFIREDVGEGPDFEAMRDQKQGIFAKGPQPFRGTIIDIHSPMCFSLRLDRDAWRVVENWERGMSWDAACWDVAHQKASQLTLP